MIYKIYKKLGETPLEALERTRAEHGIDAAVPMTFAGRLDPMAEGWMHVLSGNDVHQKEMYTGLDKSYELTVLWGVATDTYDLLGVPTACDPVASAPANLSDTLAEWVGTFAQSYPPYSAKPVQGKPLWMWARDGKLDQIARPTKQVTIYTIEHSTDTAQTSDELARILRKRIARVSGDFRQDEIAAAWKSTVFGGPTAKRWPMSRIRVRCSSGTYMRSLASALGAAYDIPTCAYSLVRTALHDELL